jgi:hypothetical protein
MAQFAPQYSLYIIIDKIGTTLTFVFWSIFALSLVPFVIKQIGLQINLDDLLNVINIIAIGIFFLLEIVQQYILIPQADSIRRDDFLDNAFDSTFSQSPSVGYYNSAGVPTGLYKAACSLFENCFFTYSLANIITLKKIIAPTFVLLAIVVFAFYGFKQVPFALTILQALFSANLLGELVKHLILLARLNAIKDSWISLFQHSDLKTNVNVYQAHIYRLWLKYEALHSSIPAGIPNKVFHRHNPTLTQDWDSMKIRYNIN